MHDSITHSLIKVNGYFETPAVFYNFQLTKAGEMNYKNIQKKCEEYRPLQK